MDAIFTKMLDNLTTKETRDVVFEVRVSNASVNVEWYKDDELITEDTSKHKMKAEGRRRSLTVVKTRPSDAGVYKCLLPKDKTQSKLTLIGK